MAKTGPGRVGRIVRLLIVAALSVAPLLAAHDWIADHSNWACRYLANGVWVETTGAPRCLETVFP